MAGIIIGTVSFEVNFDHDELRQKFPGNSDEQLQEIANVLAYNLDDLCTYEEDGTVRIVEENFTDAYPEMIADLLSGNF